MDTNARRGRAAIFSPEGRTPARHRAASTVGPAARESFFGLNKTQAEDLLDWLEANGRRKCEVSFKQQTGFTVRLR
jgi:hypothetical protein